VRLTDWTPPLLSSLLNFGNFALLCFLPEVLLEFAGPVAVYGDVDRKLETAMIAMKEFVETADLADLKAKRERAMKHIQEGFATTRELKKEQERRRGERERMWEGARDQVAKEDAEAAARPWWGEEPVEVPVEEQANQADQAEQAKMVGDAEDEQAAAAAGMVEEAEAAAAAAVTEEEAPKRRKRATTSSAATRRKKKDE
jgi:hypothetical protein